MTDDFRESFFAKMDRTFEKTKIAIPEASLSLDGYVGDGVAVVETDEIASAIRTLSHKELNKFFRNITATFGPIIISIPGVSHRGGVSFSR